jgi:DNA modification methylase
LKYQLSERFPPQFAEFFIKFLTDEGDVTLDPFAGSNVIGRVAEGLKRNWISIEKVEEYVKGSKFRVEETNTYQPTGNGKLEDAQNSTLENNVD